MLTDCLKPYYNETGTGTSEHRAPNHIHHDRDLALLPFITLDPKSQPLPSAPRIDHCCLDLYQASKHAKEIQRVSPNAAIVSLLATHSHRVSLLPFEPPLLEPVIHVPRFNPVSVSRQNCLHFPRRGSCSDCYLNTFCTTKVMRCAQDILPGYSELSARCR